MKAMLSVKTKLAVVLAAALATSTSAIAALPAGVSTGFTAVETDAGLLADAAWPVLIAITTAVVVMRLFKKFVFVSAK